MKEELEKIGRDLKAWCDKYNKDYVTMCFIQNTIMAMLSADDEDYDNCQVFIQNNKEEL